MSLAVSKAKTKAQFCIHISYFMCYCYSQTFSNAPIYKPYLFINSAKRKFTQDKTEITAAHWTWHSRHHKIQITVPDSPENLQRLICAESPVLAQPA